MQPSGQPDPACEHRTRVKVDSVEWCSQCRLVIRYRARMSERGTMMGYCEVCDEWLPRNRRHCERGHEFPSPDAERSLDDRLTEAYEMSHYDSDRFP